MFKTKLEELKRKQIDEDILINWHHRLMSSYGWIPFEEFKELPIPTVINLLEEINKTNEITQRQMNKVR